MIRVANGHACDVRCSLHQLGFSFTRMVHLTLDGVLCGLHARLELGNDVQVIWWYVRHVTNVIDSPLCSVSGGVSALG